MEWYFYDVHTYANVSRPIHYIRRLWNMGLCSSMGYSLVPATVGDMPLCKLSNCLKGVTTYHHCLWCLGKGLEETSCPVLLRQYPGTTVSTDEPATQLGIPELDEFVQYYFRAGLADTTRRMYDSSIKRFNEFCKQHKVPSLAPIDQTIICYYVSYLAKAGL